MLNFIKSLFKKKTVEKEYRIEDYPKIVYDIDDYMTRRDFLEFIKQSALLPQMLYEYECTSLLTDYLKERFESKEYSDIIKNKEEFDKIMLLITSYSPFKEFIVKKYAEEIQRNLEETTQQCKELEAYNKSLGDDDKVDEIYHSTQDVDSIRMKLEEANDTYREIVYDEDIDSNKIMNIPTAKDNIEIDDLLDTGTIEIVDESVE